MFNPEQAIAEWRRQMLAANVKSTMALEELESHLRQDIGALVLAGKPEPEAFRLAMARLGSPVSVGIEFDKINDGQIWTVKIGSLLWLAAVILMAAFLARGVFEGRMSPIVFAHVLAVTAGYGAVYLTGIFGICSVCWSLFGCLSQIRQQSLRQAVYLFSHLTAGLVIVGMMVGLPVSKQLFDEFWRWNPKEIGTLCAAVWLVALVAMQRFGQLRDHGLMLMCIGGNVVVSLAWFGAGIIDYKLRAHGYVTLNYWPLALFLGINFFFLIAGLASSSKETDMLDAQK